MTEIERTKRIEELENRIFYLNMIDYWTDKQFALHRKLEAELAELKKRKGDKRMFDDFDLTISCEEYYEEEEWVKAHFSFMRTAGGPVYRSLIQTYKCYMRLTIIRLNYHIFHKTNQRSA